MDIREEVLELEKEVKEIQEEHSFAYELLKDEKEINKRQTKRLFIIILVILVLWFITGIYLVYVLNDIGTVTEETTTQEVTQENSNGNNNFIGNDGDITNGKADN